MRRRARFKRKTTETEISVAVFLDGSGRGRISTPFKFLDHMLSSLARHGRFDLDLKARGDVEVDGHHLVEDCGLVLGRTFDLALGDRKGINRAGFFVFPMDEALAVAAVDIGGRPVLQYEAEFRRRFCGDLDTDLLPDFFQAFAAGLAANVVVRMPYGRSDHHRAEAAFKAFGRALRMACSLDPRDRDGVPSTKGSIDVGRR